MALTTVDDVATMLRWGASERTKHEAAIAAYVSAASELVEADAGPFEPRTVVHVTDGSASVTLPYRATEIVSVQVPGDGYEWVDGYLVPAEWKAASFTADLTAGIVYGPFPRGRQNVRVTFKVGYDPIPEAAKLAATMIAADKWAIASQRAPSLDEQVDPTYLMPKVVRDLLAPFKANTMPGFA